MMTDGDVPLKIEMYEVYDAFGNEGYSNTLQDQPFKFTGEPKDEGETNLIYLRARYYDPVIGRFISRDTLMGSTISPLTLNRYSYTENNPVSSTDPSGHASNRVLSSFAHDEVRLTCFDVPTGMNLNANMEEAVRNEGNYLWFYKVVKTGGAWDYKQSGNYEPFGNCHYGFAGAAMGASEYMLLSAAGLNQVETNVMRLMKGKNPVPSSGIPFISWPFGDDSADSVRISECYGSAPLYCGN